MAVAPVWTQAEKNVRLLEPRHMAVADARQGKAEAAQPRTQQRDSRDAPGLHPCRQKRQLVWRAGAEQGVTPDHLRGSEAFGRPFDPLVAWDMGFATGRRRIHPVVGAEPGPGAAPPPQIGIASRRARVCHYA